ncbi:alpha/beta hydrolase family protein [Bradyrhizobium sp. USDA 4504]
MNAGEIAVASAALDDVFSDDIVVPAADGYPLAATLFLPRGTRRQAVLINSATAVPRKVYRGFAGYLARRGAAVLTYDYRGTGGSRPMADWAALDATAAVSWMRERYRSLPFAYVGHSFGGQALGLLANNAEIPRALLIASQAAYWKLMASPERYRVVAFMTGVGLPLARTLGYLPAWAGLGMDLPRGAFEQWRSWVMRERYLLDDATLTARENFPKFKGKLRALVMTDDTWATRPAVELLCSAFTSITPEIISIRPADAGAKAIGHLGFFRSDHRDALWRGAAEWIEAEG